MNNEKLVNVAKKKKIIIIIIIAMNIINSVPRRAPKCISAMERAMELEQKPKCSS